MSLYQVSAKRWERGWELHIEGVGVTQSHSLADAEGMARDYIVMVLGIPLAEVMVAIRPHIDDVLDEEVCNAREALREAAEKQAAAASRSRAVVRKLKEAGLPGKDVAAFLGISPQRVSQLSKSG